MVKQLILEDSDFHVKGNGEGIIMMKLSARDRETMILLPEVGKRGVISTYDTALKAALTTFSKEYPDFCSLRYQTEEGQNTFVLKKENLALTFLPHFFSILFAKQ